MGSKKLVSLWRWRTTPTRQKSIKEPTHGRRTCNCFQSCPQACSGVWKEKDSVFAGWLLRILVRVGVGIFRSILSHVSFGLPVVLTPQHSSSSDAAGGVRIPSIITSLLALCFHIAERLTFLPSCHRNRQHCFRIDSKSSNAHMHPCANAPFPLMITTLQSNVAKFPFPLPSLAV